MRSRVELAALLAGWMLLAVAALWLRPLWPVDETRYVSVAWEMWRLGDFLVPHVNGEPYSHKPPLLFWLMHLGWALFGVNEWWPRLVAPLAALGAVPLTLRLARLLWPAERASHEAAAWVLFGTLLFSAFITLTMFDLLLLDCALAAMFGVVLLSQGRARGMAWLGAGIGLGVLAKGPVVLLHVLPAALLAPWWAPQWRGRLAGWCLRLLAGVLAGAAIALAWALPAALAGGEAYARAIFWGQTAGRLAESFAHRAPFWYYLPLLPLLLFPWSAWPALWRALRALAPEPPVRFLLAWLVLTVAAFSLVSGKQAKYLVPMLPAFALLAGHALARHGAPPHRRDVALPAAGFVLLAGGLAGLRLRPDLLRLPEWTADLPLWPILLLALVGPALVVLNAGVRGLAAAVLAASALVYAGIAPALAPFGDTAPMARRLQALQAAGVPVAYVGSYHAQYNFTGRLQRPLAIVEPARLENWVRQNPSGLALVVQREPAPEGTAGLLAQGPFRGAWAQLWQGAALLGPTGVQPAKTPP